MELSDLFIMAHNFRLDGDNMAVKKSINQLSYIVDKLDTVHTNLDKHIEESKIVRDELVKHGERLVWHRNWMYTISIGLIILFGLITGIKIFEG